MRDGFIRVAAGTPEIVLADTRHNARAIIDLMLRADADKIKLLVLPEMCVTGYTIADLVLKPALLDGAMAALQQIASASAECDVLTVVGLPIAVDSCIYNCAAAIKGGRVLGVVPKLHLPTYAEFYELRHFKEGSRDYREINLLGRPTPFSANLIFSSSAMPGFDVAVEICEDLWSPDPPSASHALAGATIIANPSASNELVGKADYRRLLLASQSAKLVAGYVYSDAGTYESTTDTVFAAHNMIYENGDKLNESMWKTGLIASEIDLGYILSERRRMNTFREETSPHFRINFDSRVEDIDITRFIDPAPFVPHEASRRDERCEEILRIQVAGLTRRLAHAHCKSAVVGVSGGLDSTLALIVASRAFEAAGLDKSGLYAVTMPCFGTTQRTRENALRLADGLGAKLLEINVTDAVTGHLRDISHPIDVHDVTYENAQARERTQVLMDVANQTGGIVVGTGDLSELALGWATYNGDHMSMYGVNASIPKTLIRHVVRYAADTADAPDLKSALLDVLDTPVSPELLPPVDGKISQRTEDIVGPYELHDFMLFHIIRRGEAPEKAYRLAKIAFSGVYDDETIKKWLSTFVRRFFQQQFKRSCLPDGAKVGSVSLSPRADWRMPSDASSALWNVNF